MISKKKLKKIADIVVELILASTSHGLPSVFRTERKAIKVMWFICWLIFLTLGVYTVINGVLDYLQWNVITQIDIKYEIPTPFPTVTFTPLKKQKTNYTLDEILISCYFDEIQCNESDFRQIGKSFNFNSGFDQDNKPVEFLTSALAGKETGFRIELFIGLIDDYIPEGIENKYDGLHVVVHNYTVDPRFHDGIDIAPGFATNLVVQRSYSYKLDAPYNDCIINVTDALSHDSSVFKFMVSNLNYSYRHVECYDYCLGYEMTKMCNIPDLDSFENIIDSFSTNQTMLECLNKVFEEFFATDVFEVCEPHCPLECNTLTYTVSASFSKFPNYYYFTQLINNPKITSKYPPGYNITYNDIQNSVIAFNVYYDDLKYTTITENPSVGPVDLISNMGGILGLFIGVSFLSFIEPLEMIMEIIFILFEKEKKIVKKIDPRNAVTPIDNS